MGFIIIIVLAALAVVAGYVYVNGAPGHGGVSVPWSSIDPQSIPGAVMEQIGSHPHILALALVSGALAAFIKWLWGKIGTAGRGVALVVLGIFLAYSVGHR